MIVYNNIENFNEILTPAPNGKYYLGVGSKFANRDQRAVFWFPKGIPDLGKAIQIAEIKKPRRTKNGFRKLADEFGTEIYDLMNTNISSENWENHGSRTIIRIKPSPHTPKTPLYLSHLSIPNGHTGGKNGGEWDIIHPYNDPHIVKFWDFVNPCSGGKWWSHAVFVISNIKDPKLLFKGSIAHGKIQIEKKVPLK